MRGRNLFRKTIRRTPSGKWMWSINSGWDNSSLVSGKASKYIEAKAVAMREERQLFEVYRAEGVTDLTSASQILLTAAKSLTR